MKKHYRKRMLCHLLARMDEATSATDLAKSITVLDAIHWMKLAWNQVKPETIKKCFKNCGIGDATAMGKEEEVEETVLLNEERRLLRMLNGKSLPTSTVSCPLRAQQSNKPLMRTQKRQPKKLERRRKWWKMSFPPRKPCNCLGNFKSSPKRRIKSSWVNCLQNVLQLWKICPLKKITIKSK
jgi:hypothetical protein